jgi:hypothetical protein
LRRRRRWAPAVAGTGDPRARRSAWRGPRPPGVRRPPPPPRRARQRGEARRRNGALARALPTTLATGASRRGHDCSETARRPSESQANAGRPRSRGAVTAFPLRDDLLAQACGPEQKRDGTSRCRWKGGPGPCRGPISGRFDGQPLVEARDPTDRRRNQRNYQLWQLPGRPASPGSEPLSWCARRLRRGTAADGSAAKRHALMRCCTCPGPSLRRTPESLFVSALERRHASEFFPGRRSSRHAQRRGPIPSCGLAVPRPRGGIRRGGGYWFVKALAGRRRVLGAEHEDTSRPRCT